MEMLLVVWTHGRPGRPLISPCSRRRAGEFDIDTVSRFDKALEDEYIHFFAPA
jgi:hypothetical protein